MRYKFEKVYRIPKTRIGKIYAEKIRESLEGQALRFEETENEYIIKTTVTNRVEDAEILREHERRRFRNEHGY